MAYIFLDESGDLGFDFSKKKTSKYFVISVLFVDNKRPIEKVIKNIFSGFSSKQIKSHHGILHCYKESPKTRTRLLANLIKKDLSVVAIYLNKKKVYTKLQNEKHVLYNFVANILLDRICTKKIIDKNQPIHFIASRRETNKFLNDNFKSYLKNQVQNNHNLNIKVEIKTPSQEKSLQAVDFVCWAIFRKIEHGDDRYYNIIKSKIIEESPLFP